VTQAGRRVPVVYPMNAQWLSSRTLHIGTPGTAPRGAVAAYNPNTGNLTGLRGGATELVVRVNGRTVTSPLTVG
jgi:hypothetical protein